MIARIADNQSIILEQVIDGTEECIVDHFSVREPSAYYMNNDVWDGWHRRYSVSKQRLALPFLAELKICCDKNKIPLEIIDERQAPRYPAPQEEQITDTLIEGITLMDYQVRALRASCYHEIGLFSAKTGSGKTELMCGLVQLYRCPTIIITEQIVVLEQIVERLKIRKVVHSDDIGMFCFGHMPNNNLVIVGSIQSISTPKKPAKADIKLKEKSVLERTLMWVNKERAKREQPIAKFVCQCGRSFKSKSGMTLHKKKCKGDPEPSSDHLSKALPSQEIEKLVASDEYLLKMPGKYMQVLLDYHYEVEWEKRRKWYKTRMKKAKAVQALVKKCDMLLVDEADLATSQQYARLFKHLFNGRRRYGFCLSGDSEVITEDGRYLVEELPLGPVNLLANKDGADVYSGGTLVSVGNKEEYVLVTDRARLLGSKDHLISKDSGDYVRIQDLRPGDLIKVRDDRFIYNLKQHILALAEFDGSSNFGFIFRHGLQFSRASFNQDAVFNEKVDDIIPDPTVIISDPGVLCYEGQAVRIEELHKEQLVGRGVVEQATINREIISCTKFCRELETARRVSFTQSCADLLSDFRTVNRITPELFMKNFEPFLNLFGSKKDNGHTISLYHCVLNSISHFLEFHRMINTITVKTGLSPFGLIVERFTSVSLNFSAPSFFLVCRDGKPILYAMGFEHLFFIGFERLPGTLSDVRQLLNTVSTEVSSKFAHLIIWAIGRAHKNVAAVIALDRDDIMIADFIGIPFSLDDHRFTSSKGVPIYLCQNVNKVVSVEATGRIVPMYDIVDVENCSNFYANNMLVHNSGTPFDKARPVQNLYLKEHLGSIIFEAGREEVEAAGRIVPITYYCVGVGLDGNKFDARTYDIAIKEDIIENEKFHSLVRRLAQQHPGEGTMILIDTSPIKPLGVVLEKIIEGSKFIYGETPVKEREKYIELFEKRELPCLIGSKILKRGLDLEGGCENLIIIGGGAKWSDFNQKVGRSVRLNKRGKARVFGFFFLSNKHLYRHSRENLKALVDMGYPAKVLLGGTVIDGQKFIKSRFRIPRSVRT